MKNTTKNSLEDTKYQTKKLYPKLPLPLIPSIGYLKELLPLFKTKDNVDLAGPLELLED